MSRRALLLLLLLAFVGLLKAGSAIWVGLALGFAPWVVILSAGAWACAPALAGWVWQRRRASNGTPATGGLDSNSVM